MNLKEHLERYLGVNLLGPGPRLMEKKFRSRFWPEETTICI